MLSREDVPTRALGPTDTDPLTRQDDSRGGAKRKRRKATVETSEGRTRTAPVVIDPNNLPVRLRDYELIEKVGEGGMGQVYRAKHVLLEREAAVKLLYSGAHNEELERRFRREMKAAGQLQHPNIVSTFDAGSEQGTLFLAMEFLEGENLEELLASRKVLPVADACEIIRRVAEGLAHASEHDMIHRDIKPSNIMLTKDGEVKILDLGICWMRESHGVSRITDTAGVIGTLEYMAPERFQVDTEVDERADLYSLGCTLYELLTGLSPFPGGANRSSTQWMHAHLQERPVPILQRREDVPEDLWRLLRLMLAKNPERRPSGPKQLAAAVTPFCQGSNSKRLINGKTRSPSVPIRDNPPSKPQPVSRRRSRKKKTQKSTFGARAGWYVAGALGLVLLLSLSVWALWPTNEENAPPPANEPPPLAKVQPKKRKPTPPTPGQRPGSRPSLPFPEPPELPFPPGELPSGGEFPGLPKPTRTEDGFSILLPPDLKLQRIEAREGWKTLYGRGLGVSLATFTKTGTQIPIPQMKDFVERTWKCDEESWTDAGKPINPRQWKCSEIYEVEAENRMLLVMCCHTATNSYIFVADSPKREFDIFADEYNLWFDSIRPLSR